jgi:hypothetical protein
MKLLAPGFAIVGENMTKYELQSTNYEVQSTGTSRREDVVTTTFSKSPRRVKAEEEKKSNR